RVDELRASSRPKGKPTDAERAQLVLVKEALRGLEAELDEVASHRDQLLAVIPNPPADSAPDGDSDEDAEEIRKVGSIPTFSFEAKDHLDLRGFDNPRG